MKKTNEVQVVDTMPVIRAEIDSMVATARAYPRDLTNVKKEILELAMTDEEIAKSCFYAYKRGGKMVIGPSIRFAEIIMYSWEHLKVKTRIVGQTNKFITCEAIAWDMEKNSCSQTEYQSRITDKSGNTYGDDMIAITAMSGQARARRNAIFDVIPPAVLKNIMDKVKGKSLGGFDDLEKSIAKSMQYFENEGISKESVLNILGKERQSKMTVDDLATLRAMIRQVGTCDENTGELMTLQNMFFKEICYKLYN